MPRKPRTGPPILVIEGLSDGREIRDGTFVDDFTGQVMPVEQDMRPVRDMKPAQVAKDEINRAKREVARVILENTGILPKPKQMVELIPKGYRKRGEIGGKAILRKMPPWMKI